MATKVTAKAADAGSNKAATTEKKFPLKRLQEHSRELFGVPASTFAGATQGIDRECTVSEVKEIINEWKSKEAK